MKISNAQIKIVLPLCLKAAKERPNADLDAYIDNLISLCIARGLRDLLDGLERPTRQAVREVPANRGPASAKPKGQRAEPIHPLFRDPPAA